MWVAEVGSFGAMEQQGCRGQSGEIPAQRIGADQHSPARKVCLLTAGMGGAWDLRLGPQSDAREKSGVACGTQLEGGSALQLAGRESGTKSGAAKESRDFFLPLCFLVREERGLRAPLKGAPETGVSHGYKRGLQKRA